MKCTITPVTRTACKEPTKIDYAAGWVVEWCAVIGPGFEIRFPAEDQRMPLRIGFCEQHGGLAKGTRVAEGIAVEREKLG